MVKMQIHENWQLCNVKEQEWVPAQVPGDIYMALLQAGKMEDPFWEDNEYQAKALMEEDYEYKTVFIYDETEFENCQEVILRFDGIDTIGDIYLNECCLGRVESMHRVWEFPVKEILEKGENTLRVIITLYVRLGLGCLPTGWRYFSPCNASGSRTCQTGQRVYPSDS